MRYLYYYLWLGLARIHPIVSKMFIPMNKLIIKFGRKTKDEHEKWKENYNKANLEFPGGINDWIAFGLVLLFIFIPIIIITVTFKVDIYSNKLYFWSLFIGITALCYYWLYFKNVDWLKERINKVSKKYYIE